MAKEPTKKASKKKAAKKTAAKKMDEEEFTTLDIQEDVKSNGRKPTLPSLLGGRGRNRQVAELIEEDEESEPPIASEMSHQLEDYNALERLLEAGTPEDLDTRTELNELQIVHFARAEIMAEYYGSNILKNYVASIKRKQISKNRKGRREFTDAIKSQLGNGDMGSPAGSMMDRLRS